MKWFRRNKAVEGDVASPWAVPDIEPYIPPDAPPAPMRAVIHRELVNGGDIVTLECRHKVRMIHHPVAALECAACQRAAASLAALKSFEE